MEMFSKISKKIMRHKLASGIILILIAAGGYWGYPKIFSNNGIIRYVAAQVEKGTLIVSVSGTGQVSALDEVAIKPKASGDVVWVGVKAGDAMRQGQAIAQIDATDAKQAVADAEQSLAQARLQYQKDKVQAPLDFEKALEALEDAKTDLASSYTDVFNTVSDTYLNLPALITGERDILYENDLSVNKNQANIDALQNIVKPVDAGKTAIPIFADKAADDYQTARVKYDASLLNYKNITRYSNEKEIEAMLSESIDTATAVAQAIQSTLNLFDAVIDYAQTHSVTINPSVNTKRNSAFGYLNTANSMLNALLTEQKSLDSAKRLIRNNERDIEILKIGNESGDNPLSLQSSAYGLAEKERNLEELKTDLANYTVIAPFEGTIAALNLKRFDTVSSGGSVGTLITKQKIAEVSLNEIDVTKVKTGQKATLTFDAIPDLTITGQVAEVDALGSVSQGVVTYNVKIGFDTQDDRVKTAMSVSAAIVTEAKPNVLIAPNSAVKSQGGISYVEIVEGDDRDLALAANANGTILKNSPRRQPVEIGTISDEFTEITNGLKEGDVIITRTIQPTAAQTAQTQQQSSGLRIPGLSGGGGGGGIRGGGGSSR
jgi:HlyD family secretion protein